MAKNGQHTYIENGTTYTFDALGFKQTLRRWKTENSITLEQARNRLGGQIGVSESTLRSWANKTYAPDDVERIHNLEKALGLVEGQLLKRETGTEMNKFSDRQVTAITHVYQAVSNFVYMLESSDGCAWKNYRIPTGSYAAICASPTSSPDGDDPRYEGTDLACMAYNWVCHVIENEWVVLGSHPIYDQLDEFLEGPLSDLWVDKTDPDYRFEDLPMMTADAGEVDLNDLTVPWRESEYVMKQLRDLIAPYL